MKSTFLPLLSAHLISAVASTVLLLFTLCALTTGTSCNKTPSTQDSLEVKAVQTGLASYYGPGLEGKETASGEIFHSNELVAAHPTYPLGTIARITNLEQNTTVQVRIIDRGPTRVNRKEGVIIDLSKGAAQKLKMVQAGRVRVQVEVLKWGRRKRKLF